MITIEEMNNFKRNIGQLVSLNSFLSTTLDRNLALTLTGLGGQRPHLESVLFEIVLDSFSVKEDNVSPFADIKHLSAMADKEETIIYMGSVMRIESIHSDLVNNVECICLRLCSYSDPRFVELKNFTQLQLYGLQHDEPGLIMTLGNFLSNMGENEKAASMFHLAKRRATELGIIDHCINATNAICQLQQFDDCDTAGPINALDHLNEGAACFKALKSQPDPPPEARSILDIAKPFTQFLTNLDGCVNQYSSIEDFMNDFNKSIEQISPWVQSFFPANHHIHAQLMAIRGYQQSLAGESAATEQLEMTLNRLDMNTDRNHPQRYRILKALASDAIHQGNEERALDLYMQMLDIHDLSPIRDADQQANTNVRVRVSIATTLPGNLMLL
jgi:tetratricopeptide (TPR) repeat protein